MATLRTLACGTLALAALGPAAQAQDSCTFSSSTPVTVRQINDIPQANLDQLAAATDAGTITTEQIQELTASPLLGECVRFTAVLLSWPYNSGLRSWPDGAEQPNSVFVMVRDIAAAEQGLAGMGTQINDGTLETLGLNVGDVIDIVGEVDAFTGFGANTTQIEIATIELVDSVPADSPLLDPVVVSTTDINRFVAEGDPFNTCAVNWDSYPDLNGQFVRIEAARVAGSSEFGEPGQGRVDVLYQSVGENCYVNQYDTSLRYRNDRIGVYEPPFQVLDPETPFVPPAPNAVVNVQGFLFNHGDNGGFGYDVVDGGVLSLNPMEDRTTDEIPGISLGPDIVITETPPVVSAVTVEVDGVPGDEDVPVTVTVTADPSRTITDVELVYTTSSNPNEQTAPLTDNGDGTYSGTIPAGTDGDFVRVFARATDSAGSTSDGPAVSFRVLFDGIDDIEDLQLTQSGSAGDSPFRGYTGPMDIEAVVQVAPFGIQEGSNSYELLFIQDGVVPFSGIGIRVSDDLPELSAGDRVRITNATVAENFGFTRLEDVTLEVTAGGEILAPVTLETGTLSQEEDGPTADLSEGYESMLVRFQAVTVTNNDAGFGAFRVSSNGDDDDAVVVEDDATDIPDEFGTSLTEGATYEFAQGVWYYSFGDYKLLLTSLDDFSLTTATESGPATGVFGVSAFPNPTQGTATVRFSIQEATEVRLTVYDVMGREVAVLQDGPLASSQYDAVFPADLAAGLYVVRLQAGDQAATAKVSVVR